MLCYLDKQFCSQKCANTECRMNFNDEVMEGARAWWGDDSEPPIAFGDMRTDDCGFVPVDKRRMSKSKKDLERVERNKKLSHDAFSSINSEFKEIK